MCGSACQVSHRFSHGLVRVILKSMWTFAEIPEDCHRHSRGICSDFVGNRVVWLRSRKEFGVNLGGFSTEFVRNSHGLFGILYGINGDYWESRSERSDGRFQTMWKRSDLTWSKWNINAFPVHLLRQVYNPCFFSHFFISFFGSFLEWFWSDFGTLFWSKGHLFFSKKIHAFLDPFLDAIWRDFGTPDPRKLSSRVSETLILIKSPFSASGGFLMQNGGQKPPKMELKS